MSHVTDCWRLLQRFRIKLPCGRGSGVRSWSLRKAAGLMSHTWMSHVAHSESCRSHVTHMNESCHTHEWVMSTMCKSYRSQLTHIKESCQPCGRGAGVIPCSLRKTAGIMPHMWKSHVTHVEELTPAARPHESKRAFVTEELHESCHTHVKVMSHMQKSWLLKLVRTKAEELSLRKSCRSHVTHMNGSCHTRKMRHTTHIHMMHESRMNGS